MRSRNIKAITIFFLLPVLYSIHVYPFVHFHHGHDENALRIVLSFHPIDANTEKHENTHNDDHDHGVDDHVVSDTTFIKQRPSTVSRDLIRVSFSCTSLDFCNLHIPTFSNLSSVLSYSSPFKDSFEVLHWSRGPPRSV